MYIIGGTTAVSQAVQDTLTKATQDGGLGSGVARISGADRLATAVQVHQFATRAATNTTTPGLSRDAVTTVLLARGDTFPDSLTAAVQGVGSLKGVQSINGGFGTGADPNKLNYGGEASILLTVEPERRWVPRRRACSRRSASQQRQVRRRQRHQVPGSAGGHL